MTGRMKILLIKPYWPKNAFGCEPTYNRTWPPLCLLNCAALLENDGHSVRLLDAHADRLPCDRIRRHASGFDKIFVTSSTLDAWQCPRVDISPFVEAVKAVGRTNNEVYVMGHHGTARPADILSMTAAKAVIRGEPEYTVLDICRNTDPSGINGLSYRNKEQIVHNKDREEVGLSSLPVPAFHLVDLKKYYYEVLGGRFAVLEGSRGCRHQCSFCNKTMTREGVRVKEPAQVIQEIETVVEKNGARSCQFLDLDFLSNKELVRAICGFLSVKKYKFNWSCQARVDSADDDLLKIMKKSGCSLIEYGLETVSSELAHRAHKDISLECMRQTVRKTREAGIRTLCYFLFGLPGESPADRKMTLDFIKTLSPDYISLHVVYPYPGTAIERSGLHDRPQEEATALHRTVKKAMLEFYLNPRLIISELFNGDPGLIGKKIKLLLSLAC